MGRRERVNQRHAFSKTVAVTIHGSASHTTDSRSTAAVKLAGQLVQDRPRDIEVGSGGRLEHSLHSRLDGSGRFAIQSLSLPCQSQEPPTPIAFVGPSAAVDFRLIADVERRRRCLPSSHSDGQQLTLVDRSETRANTSSSSNLIGSAEQVRHSL